MSITPRRRVALVTDTIAPHLSASDECLVAPLHTHGIAAHGVPWEATETDWSTFDLVVLRSCWNYHQHLPEFLGWIDQLEAAGIRMQNSPQTVRWNIDKRYLLDLADLGIHVIPTVALELGEQAHLADILDAQGWQQAVVKPRVSASAHGIWRIDRAGAVAAQPRLETMLTQVGALVQPVMPQIAKGEWSLVFFDGAYSHATLKVPGKDDIFVQQRFGGSTHPAQASERMQQQAAEVLHAATIHVQADTAPLYARVDGLDVDGQFVLMELELIEPGLFLNLTPPDASARFAAAIAAKLH